MLLDEINTVLELVSQELRGAELVAAYDNALFEEDMLSAFNSFDQGYDNDAIGYGELV